MAYRVNRMSSSTSTVSNASRRGVEENGIAVETGTRASHSSSPKQRSEHEMKKDMLKKLNSAGRNMHELQAILLQESILTGDLLDSCLEPLVSRYSEQIKVADSVLNSADAGAPSRPRNKEKYHYYLEELQDFDWGKSQYDDFMNSTMMEKDYTTSEVVKGSENENPVPLSLSKAEGLSTEDEDVTHLSKDNGSGDLKRVEFGEKTTGSYSVTELEKDNCYRVNSIGSIASNNASTTKSSCQKNSSSKLKTAEVPVNERQNKTPSKPLSTELTNSDDENIISDMSEDVTDSHRFKVLRRKQKSNSLRPRMLDVFPLDEYVPSSTSSLNQSLNHASDHSFLNESGDIPWANKSKSANESWYEFKERCSATSLPQRSSETSNRRVDDTHSPFKLRDYIPDKAVSPHRKSTKSVRFSPSPNGHPSRDRVPYSDSSSDDNVSFDVEQFPCIDVRRQRFQRSNGRVRLRK